MELITQYQRDAWRPVCTTVAPLALAAIALQRRLGSRIWLLPLPLGVWAGWEKGHEMGSRGVSYRDLPLIHEAKKTALILATAAVVSLVLPRLALVGLSAFASTNIAVVVKRHLSLRSGWCARVDSGSGSAAQ